MFDTIANIFFIFFIVFASAITIVLARQALGVMTQWGKSGSASIAFLKSGKKFVNVKINYPKGQDIWAAAYNQEGDAVSLHKVTVRDREGTVQMDDSAKLARLFVWNGPPSDVILPLDSQALPNSFSCLTEVQL